MIIFCGGRKSCTKQWSNSASHEVNFYKSLTYGIAQSWMGNTDQPDSISYILTRFNCPVCSSEEQQQE
jgi:hypothetical protein